MKTAERALLMAIAVIFIPLTIFSGWMSVRGFSEETLFLDAPDFTEDKESRLNGVFGKVSGKLEYDYLNPKEWPEVSDALEWAVIKQKHEAGHWVRNKEFTKEHGQVQIIKIGEIPVLLSRSAQYFLKMKKAHRMINGLERYEIRWISPAKNEDIAAFGVYQSGAIQEGHFERLTVVEAGTEAKWVADLARGGE